VQVAGRVLLATVCGGSRAVGTSERGRGINTCTASETEVNTDIKREKIQIQIQTQIQTQVVAAEIREGTGPQHLPQVPLLLRWHF